MKRKGVHSDAGHLEDGRLRFQSPSQHLSAGRGFYKEGEGTQNKENNGRGWKVIYVQTSTVHSHKDLETGQGMVWCVPSWLFCVFFFISSWFYVILVFHSWRSANLPELGWLREGQSLYLLKLVSNIVTHTCCLSTSYILIRVRTYRNNAKRTLWWVTISSITGDLAWGGEHIIQCADDVLWNCAPETCIFCKPLSLQQILKREKKMFPFLTSHFML